MHRKGIHRHRRRGYHVHRRRGLHHPHRGNHGKRRFHHVHRRKGLHHHHRGHKGGHHHVTRHGVSKKEANILMGHAAVPSSVYLSMFS